MVMAATQFKKIGIIGAGAIGSNVALLFSSAPTNLEVSLYDKDINLTKSFIAHAPTSNRSHLKGPFKDLTPFAASLEDEASPLPNKGRVVLLCLPYDQVLRVLTELQKDLREGDVVIDASDSYYRDAEARQKIMNKNQVLLLSLGIAGGYQDARRGPSMALSGEDCEAKKKVLGLLQAVSGKDSNGHPCAIDVGEGGTAHFVKMVHDGIEQGMMGVLNEAWEIMFKCLSMKLGEIAEVFGEWVTDGGKMHNNYLLAVGSEVCYKRKSHITQSGSNPTTSTDTSLHEKIDHLSPFLVNSIQDTVTQDVPTTTTSPASTTTAHFLSATLLTHYISAPTIAASHYYRVASSHRAQRLALFQLVGGEVCAAKKQAEYAYKDSPKRKEFLDHTLRHGVYIGFLTAYAQGINVLLKAARVASPRWPKDRVASIVGSWRTGAIIEDDSILDLLLKKSPEEEILQQKNLLPTLPFAAELSDNLHHLKDLVLKGVEWDAHVPALSAALEYIKYCGGKHLPTQFMQAQIDYFGARGFDLKKEAASEEQDRKGIKGGGHHFEWEKA
ncbi:6-phosphogluconate dehydrogenase [Peziza echinospora]|nr:6-phosphogluconate dehydrogenase [Peziza echinospora]